MDWERFTRGTPSFLRVAFAGFVIGALGVTLTFGAQGISWRFGMYVGFVIVVIGVTTGSVAVIAGLLAALRHGLSKDGNDVGTGSSDP